MQPRAETLSAATFRQLTATATVIESDTTGAKVLALADGSYLKLFRVKRRWSSARLWPYSARFALNAGRLAALGIPTVTVIALWRIPSMGRSAVRYTPLPGETVATVAARGALDEALAARLGTFVAALHQRGVLFRSLHLGNIVLMPNGQPGLIDVADLRCHGHLGWRRRARNFRHLLRRPEDRAALQQAGLEQLLAAYFDTESGLGVANRERLCRRIDAIAARPASGAAPS